MPSAAEIQVKKRCELNKQKEEKKKKEEDIEM